jgi:RNA polymerase sigma-70 factor, ECF subfamily
VFVAESCFAIPILYDLAPMAEMPDDYELMERIAGHDADALGLMFDRYGGLIFTLGLRMLRDRGEAEELVSDVFLEIWRRAERYDPNRGAPMTYLVTLGRSRAIDRQRSTASRLKGQISTDSTPDAPSDAPDPGAAAMVVENAKRVRSAMGQLEPIYRQCVELAFFDGLSHTQIAEKLNKPLGTIKTYIRQGLIRLRDCLRKD